VFPLILTTNFSFEGLALMIQNNSSGLRVLDFSDMRFYSLFSSYLLLVGVSYSGYQQISINPIQNTQLRKVSNS